MNSMEKCEMTIRQCQIQAMYFATLCEQSGYGDAQEWWTLSAMYGTVADSIQLRNTLPVNLW